MSDESLFEIGKSHFEGFARRRGVDSFAEAVKWFGAWDFRERIHSLMTDVMRSSGVPEALAYADEIDAIMAAELDDRRYRCEQGVTFETGAHVTVIEDLKWWPSHIAFKPEVGIRGIVSSWNRFDVDKTPKTSPDLFGHVYVRFHARDLKTGWQPGDDPDRKYRRYWLPNYALEKIK